MRHTVTCAWQMQEPEACLSVELAHDKRVSHDIE